MLSLILITLSVILISKWIIDKYLYWERKKIAHTKGWPIFGNMMSVFLRRKSFLDFTKELYNQFPNERYNGILQFNKPMLVVRDLDLIKQVTVKDFDYFMDHNNAISEDVDRLLGKNLFALQGQRWRNMRGTLSPSFTGSKMKTMYILLTECSEQFVGYFLKNNTQDIIEQDLKDPFTRFTNDAIATIAFGLKCDSLSERENQFYMMGRNATNFTGLRATKFFLFNMWPKFMKALGIPLFPREVNTFFYNLVKDTIELREKNNIIRPDMIQLLMAAREDKGEGKINLTLEDIVAQAFIFFFAGFETTATLMSFIAYELAINPEIQKKLQNEIDEATRKENGKISYENLMKMKYLDMVVSETLRKWPLGFQLDRLCVKDYEISSNDPKEKSFTVEKGTVLIIPVYGIHHDPDYFPNPDIFDPERFNDENKQKMNSVSYMPFGSGPRSCIASRLALLENKTLFVHLLSNFDIVPIDKTPIPLTMTKGTIVMKPEKGFWLGLKRRKTTEL